MSTIHLCEFSGDTKHSWDEVGFKKACKHIGFVPTKADVSICILHQTNLGEHEGWRVCCSECTAPIQVKQKACKQTTSRIE